jgi:GMP synthase (glutamine-hydrolysing)
MSATFEKIVILDFGSQYTQLIARRVRETGVYCEIHPFNLSTEQVRSLSPKGIILSGGPASVYEKDAPHCEKGILELGIPVLGICYGVQLISYFLGGEVAPSSRREYGPARVTLTSRGKSSLLFRQVTDDFAAWMSHGDHVTVPPSLFEILAESDNALGAIEDTRRGLYGLQFHPEVVHTPIGKTILGNFAKVICQCQGDWNPGSFIESAVKAIREQVGEGRALCGLSGGVDSSVAAVLVSRAIGERLTCLFVDNGLLRKNEFDQVLRAFSGYRQLKVSGVAAGERFLSALQGVSDPEQKRKIIGREFIEVFQEQSRALGQYDYLVQGTLYPDVIESVSVKGPSAVIKSHHNVGGLPEKMHLKLIEPLRELFKDEVRAVGRELGLPAPFLSRHPFPGPGLAVRIPGPVDADSVRLLQEVDWILQEEILTSGLYDAIWQAFAVLLPVRTVGVMGDLRTYERVVAVRAVESEDGMTAHWAKLPYDLLERLSSRIVNEVKGVNRVVYDISSKPPGTIEWE